MKKFHKIFKFFTFALILSILTPTVLTAGNPTVAQAATIKLNKKTLSLEVGKTTTLKVLGSTKKATWSSNKKSVATVSSSGKVTAVKVGTATITATIDKKKYSCTVTVKEPVSKYITEAPFDAQELTFAGVTYVTPKNWKQEVVLEQGNNVVYSFQPDTVDPTTGSSNISLVIQETGEAKPEYSIIKEYFQGYITQDLILNQLAQSGLEATITDFVTSDYEAELGTAFKTQYNAVVNGISMTQIIYDLYIDNYLVEVTVTDIKEGITPDVNVVAEYLLNSLQLKK
ncbi:MAG: hypothetical protein K0S47_496 [Herbinix sp.]|jgi:hypothetical protein|nr:hypothetical protein [Herbinix sp.]